MTAQRASTELLLKPFSKVLIANRGEIAVRVIRAAHDEGLDAVSVYAGPDRDAMHVRMADEAYSLEGDTAAETYLRIDKIIRVAQESGADAVHPGYGFLAENADFARAVLEAGLVWIGPSPSAIDSLGDKVAARQIAQKVGAPLAPGTQDPVESADEVLAFADEHGLPLAIKAAYGEVVGALRSPASAQIFPSCLNRPCGKPPPRLVVVSVLWSASWRHRATLRPSASQIPPAMLPWSRPATARCNGGTRSWWKKHPHRF